MKDESSIKRQLQRERNLIPPYCPRESCKYHHGSEQRFWRYNGRKTLKRFPYTSIRFRCKACNKTFSSSFFSLNYRQKIWGLNKKIYLFHCMGVSKREIARQVKHDEGMVRGRLIRIARSGLLIHASAVDKIKISEALVYDGLENFSFSQYDPNNINHAVGKESLFTYDFNYCPLNRKGMMSDRQKRKKQFLENEFGAYPRDAIRSSTKRVFSRLLEKTPVLTIYSDRHFQYRRVVEIDLADKKIEHIRVCSKIARNFKNHLFAVNNIDMQARHNLAAFKRETIAFAKNSVAMLENFVLYMLYRNYMRPKFWGTHRSDPESSKKSPAMELKLRDKIQSFDEFFSKRILPSHVTLNDDWKALYCRLDPLSRRPIRPILN